jgi:RNA polymerase sigma-70 factor (ECF subfamily)
MQLLPCPSSAIDRERNTEQCRGFICETPIRDTLATTSAGRAGTEAFAPHLEDLAVLRQIQNQAMAWLYEKYAEFIYSISLRIVRDPSDAEDVLQDVLIHIWRSPEQLRIGKSLFPWIAVVSRNRSIDKIRRRRPSESIDGVVLASPNDSALQSEQNLMCKKVFALFDGLPPEQRTVLEMAYFSEMSHSQIADRTGSPLGTIKTRIRDALKNLRKDLQPGTRAAGTQNRKA